MWTNSLVRYNDLVFKIGLDAWGPSIAQAKLGKKHQEQIKCKYEEIEQRLGKRKYNFIIAIDFIEHLEKEDGEKLIKFIKENCNIGAVLYTPNGFLYQPSLEEGDFQFHRSGWNIDELENHGFKITGAAGLKCLRKEFHEIKYKPILLWQAVSYISQVLITKKMPRFASALWATYLKK